MDDLRFSRLERHKVSGTRDKMVLSVPMPSTPSGKFYQYSPNPEAAPRLFLMGAAPADRILSQESRALIRREPGPGQTVCPYSGHVALDEEFVHFDDIEMIKKQVMWEAEQDVGDYIEKMAKDFNVRQPRQSFISMRMDIKRPHRPKPVPFREDLLRNLECG